LQADGGTRTASVTGAFVALSLAFRKMLEIKSIKKMPLRDYLAATSVGIYKNEALLDLCYEEDSKAEVDMNVVMTGGGRFVELQATAEQEAFDDDQMSKLVNLARVGIVDLIALQREIAPIS
jgi:ribonuclease PH